MAAKTKTHLASGDFDQVAVRLPVAFFERIEKHAARMRAASPGVDVKRADALRNLIALGLAAAEKTALNEHGSSPKLKGQGARS